jgi:hypothetical protein
MNGIFCAVRAKVLYAGQLEEWVSSEAVGDSKNVNTVG